MSYTTRRSLWTSPLTTPTPVPDSSSLQQGPTRRGPSSQQLHVGPQQPSPVPARLPRDVQGPVGARKGRVRLSRVGPTDLPPVVEDGIAGLVPLTFTRVVRRERYTFGSVFLTVVVLLLFLCLFINAMCRSQFRLGLNCTSESSSR